MYEHVITSDNSCIHMYVHEYDELIFLLFTVTAQEGPGIVIGRPGEDVELLCNVTPSDPSNQWTAWLINDSRPYTTVLLHNGILQRDGYSALFGGSNLIVEDIIMNDARNNSDFTCVVVLRNDTLTIVSKSDPITLHIAGECKYVQMF